MPSKRSLVAKDIFKFQFISDPQISPDGSEILFTHTRCLEDKKKNTYQSHIWKVSAAAGSPRLFTNSTDSESHPRWSPNGSHICFVSSRDSAEDKNKSGQIWIIPSGGGEARKLTSRKYGASNPKWAPDGKRLLFCGRVPISSATNAQPGKARDDVAHITRLSYRFNGTGYIYKYRTHLFVISARGGRPKQLTSGDWDVENAAWSPDGKRIYLSGNAEENADYTYARCLYALPSAGGRLKKLCQLPGGISAIAPGPDGKTIAFVGSDLSRSYGTNSRIYCASVVGGSPTCLTSHLDLSVGQSLNSDVRYAASHSGLMWTPDAHLIKFIATERGVDRLFALDIKTGALAVYTDAARTIESVSYSADHTAAAYSVMSSTNLPEIHLWREGKPDKVRTSFNRTLLSRLRLSEPRRFAFKAGDGVEVEGWIMIPPGTRRAKHPAILQIHGGPRTAYGLGFMHEFQLLAARGFAVFYINPRGSSSYGEDWACAVGGHYGERDCADILEAVDHIVKTEPVDPRRLGITGGSYGGFMTNWIIGHTDRFKAACAQRSISNFVSFFGTSDIGWRFLQEEIGDLPWTNLHEYWKRSPLAYAEDMNTPLLIIHSEEDWRCPIEQAEQLFAALKWRGVETEFVRFAGENHELSRAGKPLHRLQRLTHIVRWFEKYLHTK